MKKKLLAVLCIPALLVTGCKDKEGGDDPVNPPTPPASIENLRATGVKEGIVLNWKSQKEATSYVIYNGESKVCETEFNFFTLPFLTNGTEYRLGVSAKNSSGETEVTYITSTPDATKDYDPFIEDLNTSLEKRITSSKIKTMYPAGNLNTDATNLERLKSVVDKMKSGTSQTIAYIGGSITVGEKAKALDDDNHQKGYAYYSYKWLQEHYDKNRNSKFINASISGTDSSIATVRLEKDVLQYNPDLVFVEFAANNGTTSFDQKTYESLIRRLLLQEQKPAVMLLFSAVHYANNEINYMKPVGDYYHLPMFSMYGAMNAVCGSLQLTDSIFKYFAGVDEGDNVHPSDQGHQLYAKILAQTLKNLINREKVDSEYVVPTTPSKERNDDYVNFTYINNESNNAAIKSLGSFEAADTSERVLKETADVEAFQKGWKKTTKTANEAMTIEVTCKSFFIIYLAGNKWIENDPTGMMTAAYQNKAVDSDKGSLTWNAAKVQKQIDLTNLADNGDGWDNPCCMILIDNTEAATYTITIKMDSNENPGTVLALGYCA